MTNKGKISGYVPIVGSVNPIMCKIIMPTWENKIYKNINLFFKIRLSIYYGIYYLPSMIWVGCTYFDSQKWE